MDETLTKLALDYHAYPTPGKISVTPTKTLANQDDLSLAYSPGVAAACMAIFDQGDDAASKYTSRGNLVGVITNGTAVLGLGNIGPLAAKPVMEGKGCLFKKFAGIDVFDIELAENDPDKLVDIIAALEPTLGGVNLEDIKAPECFYIEKKLRERMSIPVFHDDQHGTAIVTLAALINALKIVGKKIEDVKLATTGMGAAGISCVNMLVQLGLKPENILLGADGHLKLIDFGFAKHTKERCWTLCGTPDYLAPEVIRAKGYNASVDWWSVGVLLFEMLAGYPPFYTEDGNPIKLYEKIIAGHVNYPSFFEPGAKDLLQSLLTADLSKRFGNLHRGSRDIFAHMWFAEIDWECLYRKEIPAPYIPNINMDGDASKFERYPENDLSEYERPDAPDEYPHLFPDF